MGGSGLLLVVCWIKEGLIEGKKEVEEVGGGGHSFENQTLNAVISTVVIPGH